MTFRLPDLDRIDVIAADAECTGLNWRRDELFGISFSWLDGGVKSLYLDVRLDNERAMAAHLLARAKLVVNHNIKYDYHFCREAHIPMRRGHIDCTMIRAALIDENLKSHSLDHCAFTYLNERKYDPWQELAELFGGKPNKKDQIGNLPLAPRELVAKYANQDSRLALMLWYHQNGLIEQDELQSIHALEIKLLDVVIRMEQGGVRVDLDAAAKAKKFLTRRIDEDQRTLDKLALSVVGAKNGSVNVNSNPQVNKIVCPVKGDDGIWRAKDGTVLEETEGGGPSMKTAALLNMRIPEAVLVAKLRGFYKARETFIDTYIFGMNDDGYLHANINQTKNEEGNGTYTGRLSVTDPALQQIHKRDKELAAIIRALFVPDEGCVWGSYDWEQMDFRMFAHYTKSRPVLEAYARDRHTDFHRFAADVTGLPRNRDAKTGGANAKQINLGLVFGMGEGRMAAEMGLPFYKDERGFFRAGDAAMEVFNNYHTAIPGVREFRNQCEAVAKARGWVRTPLNRRIRFPNPRMAYKAAGLLFQAAAADALKIKMIELDQMLDGTGDRLALVVHDEFDVMHKWYGKEQMLLKKLQIEELLERFDGRQTPITFMVPIVSKGAIGMNWWDASSGDAADIGRLYRAKKVSK